MDSSYGTEFQARVPLDCCMTSSNTFCFNVSQEVVVRNYFQRPFLIGRIPGHNSLSVGHRGGTINSCQEPGTTNYVITVQDVILLGQSV